MLENEEEIIQGLKEGAPEAFRLLYSALGKPLFAYLCRLTGKREVAEELTQEAFLMVIRKIVFFKSRADGGLKAWVFRIASNLALDQMRRWNVAKKQEDEEALWWKENPENAPSAERQLANLETQREIELALECLTATQHMIFLLKEQEEMTALD